MNSRVEQSTRKTSFTDAVNSLLTLTKTPRATLFGRYQKAKTDWQYDGSAFVRTIC